MSLGKTLLIANPVAQNGKGAAAARYAAELLGSRTDLEVVMTEAPHHAIEIASHASCFETVVALGGDGVIHEVVNGLMSLAQNDRPTLGIIPVGSGNDYARTLCISEKVDKAVAQLWSAACIPADVGCCNGVYFMETLSFGFDAAIALDTVERRKRTGKTGTALYLESGIDQLLHHLDVYRYTVAFDGREPVCGETFIMAVQIGPTYGGGFLICPQARIDDGLFDICVAHPPLSLPRALYIFLRAKNGHHTRCKQIEFERAASLHLRFDRRPPVQIDGEPLIADEYAISIAPRALNVLGARG